MVRKPPQVRTSRPERLAAQAGGRPPHASQAGNDGEIGSSFVEALVTPDHALDALLDTAGVIRVGSLEALTNAASLLAGQPSPHQESRAGAIVTNGSGPGVLALDACRAAGLETPWCMESTRQRLPSVTSTKPAAVNPVYLLTTADADAYAAAITLLLADDDIDAVLVVHVPTRAVAVDDICAAIVFGQRVQYPEKPVLTCLWCHPADRVRLHLRGERRTTTRRARVPVPERAVAAPTRLRHGTHSLAPESDGIRAGPRRHRSGPRRVIDGRCDRRDPGRSVARRRHRPSRVRELRGPGAGPRPSTGGPGATSRLRRGSEPGERVPQHGTKGERPLPTLGAVRGARHRPASPPDRTRAARSPSPH